MSSVRATEQLRSRRSTVGGLATDLLSGLAV
jgi:hypothetical protein